MFALQEIETSFLASLNNYDCYLKVNKIMIITGAVLLLKHSDNYAMKIDKFSNQNSVFNFSNDMVKLRI